MKLSRYTKISIDCNNDMSEIERICELADLYGLEDLNENETYHDIPKYVNVNFEERDFCASKSEWYNTIIDSQEITE